MLRKKRNEPAKVGEMPQVDPHQRIYAIGDIHGRHDLLIALFSRILSDAERHEDGRRVRIVFLGDYIDRGDQSREVLLTLASLAESARHETVFLKGNHEAALLDFLRDASSGAAWLSYGGLQTLASFGIKGLRTESTRQEIEGARQELAYRIAPFLPFLRTLDLRFRSGDVVFTHAGIDPSLPFEKQPETALLWGNGANRADVPVQGIRVVHGHFDDPNPVSTPGRICVDTGAYYTGVLTAIRLDAGEEFLSVGR